MSPPPGLSSHTHSSVRVCTYSTDIPVFSALSLMDVQIHVVAEALNNEHHRERVSSHISEGIQLLRLCTSAGSCCFLSPTTEHIHHSTVHFITGCCSLASRGEELRHVQC